MAHSSGVAAAILLVGLIGTVGYGVSFLTTPAAGWLEKAPYGAQQLQRKLLPLKKPMAQVAQASDQLEKLATPTTDPQAPPTVSVKPSRLTDSLYGRTQEFVLSTVLLLILLYFLLAYDEVFLSKLIKMMPRLEDKKRAVSIAHEIESHVSRYLLTVTLINTGLGVAVGTTVGPDGTEQSHHVGHDGGVAQFRAVSRRVYRHRLHDNRSRPELRQPRLRDALSRPSTCSSPRSRATSSRLM